MAKHDYRSLAREAFSRAKHELKSAEANRLRYAALELRMAIEGVVYGRAEAYQREIGLNGFEAWQPNQVMERLLEIDPHADIGGALWIGLEDEPGEESKDMEFLGKEETLRLAEIKKRWMLLGSYLHVPTVKQLRNSGPPDHNRLRERCDEIVAMLERVFASPIHNAVFGEFGDAKCIRCGSMNTWRCPPKNTKCEGRCRSCNAPHLLSTSEDKETTFSPITKRAKCMADGCGALGEIWQDQLKVGAEWTCERCKKQHRVGLALSLC